MRISCDAGMLGCVEARCVLKIGKFFAECHIIWNIYKIYMTHYQGKSTFYLKKSYNFGKFAQLYDNEWFKDNF